MIEEARSRAGQYGPNVEFVSATPVKTETLGGYKALYAFKDINTLRINQNPKNKTGKPGDGQDHSAKKEEVNPLQTGERTGIDPYRDDAQE